LHVRLLHVIGFIILISKKIMKDIPFEAAKQFCENYQKDQCIILSWDKQSGKTWVTTFGVGDENSIQATNAGKTLKDYLKLQRENDCIPTRFDDWKIESVDRYYYKSGRNYNTYVETTYWYEAHTMQRKETNRQVSELYDCSYRLPEWAKSITENRKTLNCY
jgi:hypothetical protein